MRIKVWHGEKHDEAAVAEMEVSDLHRWVKETKDAGGFFYGTHKDKNFRFVPWHRIGWIEQVEEDADAAQKGAKPKDGK